MELRSVAGQTDRSKGCDIILAEGPMQVGSKSPSDSHDSITWSNKLAHYWLPDVSGEPFKSRVPYGTVLTSLATSSASVRENFQTRQRFVDVYVPG